jgi:hypothetical protein
MRKSKLWTFVAGFVTAAALVAIVALRTPVSEADAETAASGASSAAAAVQEAPDPTAALSPRDVYYPGSEDLVPDEMRVIQAGSGVLDRRARQRRQVHLRHRPRIR